jgi:hypothetical protein
MDRLKYFLTSGIVLFSLCIYKAQTVDYSQFLKDSMQIMRVKEVRPQFKFDNRVSFYEKQALDITGFDIGVLLVDKLRLTLGYYGMKDRLKAFDYMREDEKFGRIIQLNYGSLNTELIYKDTRFLSWGMPLELGAGVNKFQDKNITTGEVISTQTGALMFVNFGASATYKPMRFLGLKGILGYRKVAFNQVKDFNFDGFFTSLGLNIDVHAIVTDVKMFRLKKRYHRGTNISNAVEIITE